MRPSLARQLQLIRCISLDVTGTLLTHTHPIYETYSKCAFLSGLNDPPTPEELKPAFKQAYKQACLESPGFGSQAGISSRTWWAHTVRGALTHCGRSYSDADFDRYFRRVYQHYGTPVSF